MLHTVKIESVTESTLNTDATWQLAREISNTGATQVEIRVVDPRNILDEQRRKARALVRDIAMWSGYEDPDYIHMMMKYDFATQSGIECFSLADCDMTTARLYITYLIDFCILHSVPTRKPLYAFCDDLEAMVYSHLANRSCAVHNRTGADIHHCTGSRVGMGRDRKTIIHVGLVCLPLCRECHDECHLSEVDFLKKHHLVGLPLDAWLCQRLGLNTEAD